MQLFPSTTQVRSRFRCAGSLVAITVSLLTTGCLSTKQYLDPELPKVAIADLKPVQERQPVQLFVEFQTKGSANAKATEYVRPFIANTMQQSKLFEKVVVAPETAERKLFVTINNVPVTQDAVSKGVVTGLTFGLAGSAVTDGYLMSSVYTVPGKKEVRHDYKHAIHTTIGNAQPPANLQALEAGKAVPAMVEDLILNMLNDMSRAGEL